MFFQIIQPIPALRPYTTRYVFVRAEGSTDTMTPPEGDPRFVNGKHVQTLLPNYGTFIFMRNVVADVHGTHSDGLVLLGAHQTPIGLTTLSGWFEGMLLDFEPGGLHALLGIDLQQLSGQVLTAEAYGDAGLLQLDALFKATPAAENISPLIDAFFLGHLPHTADINYERIRKVVAACDAAKGNIAVHAFYNFTGVVDLMGLAFDYPESLVQSKAWVGKGPYRVWQNRMHGPQSGFWQTDYNDPVPAESYEYPEFKGYFADVAWMSLQTAEGRILLGNGKASDDYIGV